VTILIKPLLYLMVLGQVAVLFASAVGLVCWLLIKCVRAIAGLLPGAANVPRLLPPAPAIGSKLLKYRD
jgi:hypothetical protein